MDFGNIRNIVSNLEDAIQGQANQEIGNADLSEKVALNPQPLPPDPPPNEDFISQFKPNILDLVGLNPQPLPPFPPDPDPIFGSHILDAIALNPQPLPPGPPDPEMRFDANILDEISLNPQPLPPGPPDPDSLKVNISTILKRE